MGPFNVDLGAVGAPVRVILVGPETHAADLTALEVYEHSPGIPFIITRVMGYNRSTVLVTTADVKKDGVSVLTAPMTLAAAVEVKGVLAALALISGTAANKLTFHITTGATTGASVGAIIQVEYRLLET